MGGGAAPAPRSLVDPELTALSQLFLAAAPPERPPGRIQQLTLLLTALMTKLVELVSAPRPETAGAGPADPGMPASIAPALPPQPLQPPPPPTVLFLAPGIVDMQPDPAGSESGAEGDGGDGSRASEPDAGSDVAPPSSWLPIPGVLRPDRLTATGRGLLQRLDDLCDDLGLTRLALVACSLLAPLAAALLIQTVAALLS